VHILFGILSVQCNPYFNMSSNQSVHCMQIVNCNITRTVQDTLRCTNFIFDILSYSEYVMKYKEEIPLGVPLYFVLLMLFVCCLAAALSYPNSILN
jgi:hypothetical protein